MTVFHGIALNYSIVFISNAPQGAEFMGDDNVF